jgi:cytochrome P450
LQKIIAERRADSGQFDDFLSMLMGASDEGNSTYMSDGLLRDEAMTLFLAGHETTANALTWTWYLLAQYPAVEEKMAREIRRLEGELPKLEDLELLPYTSQVLREALRLYPPAWILGRQAVTDYELGQVPVPAGAVVFLSPFATQRDPRLWRDPEVFDPDRWSDGSAIAGLPKFAYFPFGAGTRVCIGEHFAMMEGILALATIAQRCQLHMPPGQRVELWPQITLRPKHSMRFTVHTRTITSGVN